MIPYINVVIVKYYIQNKMETNKVINFMWTIFWIFFCFCGFLIALGISKIAMLICMFICALIGIGIQIKTKEIIE